MCFSLFFSSLLPAFSEFKMGKKIENISEIHPYQNLRYCDLSALDLTEQSDLLYTLEFNTETKWPSADKLPKGFDPNRILEYGKQPGLNTSKAHQIATGKGAHRIYCGDRRSTQSVYPSELYCRSTGMQGFKRKRPPRNRDDAGDDQHHQSV